MSGPKAFRIVTRAEIVAICRRNLARLDAAVESWTSVCRANETIRQSDIDEVVGRRNAIRQLLDADRFTDLQKQVAAEISYLQADIERRAEGAAAAEAKSRQDLRRSKAAAEAVLVRLETSGTQIPSDLRADLKSSSSDRLNSAVARALLMLPLADTPQGVTDRQRELAGRLGEGERRDTLQEWMSRHGDGSDDQVLTRVDRLLGELNSLGVDPSPFSARIFALESEAPSRRSLVADSLLIELAAAVKTGRDRQRVANDLRERRAELSQMRSPEAIALSGEIEKALTAPSGNQAVLLKRADELIEAEVQALAAEERRRVVLQGLASLGYEVSEGMTTAWVSEGRVVLRKAANPGYGVELSGGTKSDLLQVRAVGIGNSAEARDSARDRDMETIWCGEFERLQALVAKSGGSISIETARPVGQFPLKVVSDPGISLEHDVSEKSLRSLRH